MTDTTDTIDAAVADDDQPQPDPAPDLLPARTGAVGSVLGDLPVIPERNETTAIAQLANTLAAANACPSALRGKPNDVFLVLLTARDLGVSLTTAMREFHVIEGKVTLSPKVKLALVRQSGLGRIWPDAGNDETQATWHGERTDMPGVVVSSTFTVDDARRAGLDGKQNWRNYPARMMSWRAAGFLLDDLFAEVGTGLYQPDELGAVTDAEGDPIDVRAVEALPGLKGGKAAPREFETADAETLGVLRVRVKRVNGHPEAQADLRAWAEERELPPIGDLSPAQARTLAAKLAAVEVAYGLVAEGPGGEPVKHDCGHSCCDERSDPHHDHFLDPTECPACNHSGSVEAPVSAARPVPPPTVPEPLAAPQGAPQTPLPASEGWCDGDVTEWVLAKAAAMTAGDIRLAFVGAGLESPRGKVDELRRSYSFWLFEAVAVGLLRVCSGFALSAETIVAANLEATP